MKSGHALVGGMVDQSIPAANGKSSITVLHGGFLIAPKVSRDWWWYKDRE